MLVLQIEDGSVELSECSALQGFCKCIGQHLLSRTVLDGNLVGLNSVSDKEASDVGVSCAMVARLPSIFLQQCHTLVVLKHQLPDHIGPHDTRHASHVHKVGCCPHIMQQLPIAEDVRH